MKSAVVVKHMRCTMKLNGGDTGQVWTACVLRNSKAGNNKQRFGCLLNHPTMQVLKGSSVTCN